MAEDRIRSAPAASQRALRQALARGPEAASEAHLDERELSLYVAGALSAAEIERVEAHAAACALCAEDLVSCSLVEVEARGAAIEAGAPPAQHARPGAERAARRAGDRDRALPRSRGRRIFTRLAASVALVATGAAALSASERFAARRLQPELVRRLADATGRSVAIDSTSLRLLGGPGLEATGVSIGEDPSFAGSAFARVEGVALSVDAAALLRGRLYGDVRLDSPTIRLARDATGRWNVESLGGGSAHRGSWDELRRAADAQRSRDTAARREEPSVRLTSATIEHGTLVVSDEEAGGSRSLTLRDVDVSLASPNADAPATLSLRAVAGADARPLEVRGEVGPFTGGDARYELTTVRVDALPVASIPGAPPTVSGDLSFTGQLTSRGDGLDAVVRNATGSGDLRIAAGALADGNLDRKLVSALGRELVGADGASLLARAEQSPALAARLGASGTAFDALGGAVQIDPAGLRFADLVLDGRSVRVQADGSLARSGALAIAGTAALDREMSAALTALAPALRPLVGGSEQLALPFKASGRWPKVDVALDLRGALASAAQRLAPPALLAAFGAPGAERTAALRPVRSPLG